MESKKDKINQQTKQKQTHRYREKTDGCQMEGGLGNWVKNVKGLRSTNWLLQNNHRDVRYSIGNVVNNTVITMYGATWLLDLSGGSLHKLYTCLCTMYT